MAALALVPKAFKHSHLVPMQIYVQQLTTLDWINFSGIKGILSLNLMNHSSTTNTAPNAVTWQYGVMLANGAVASTTTTTINIDGAGADATNGRLTPYYIKSCTGEIMEVVNDSTPKAATSVLTVRRGALGTTAVNIADNDYFCILNQIVVTSGTSVGWLHGLIFPFPEEGKAKME